MSIELGSVLAGIAAIVVAISAIDNRRTRRKVEATSPPALLGALDQMRQSYRELMERAKKEREGMEGVIRRERERADRAELLAADTQVAIARVEAELIALRQRFDRLTGGPSQQPNVGGPV